MADGRFVTYETLHEGRIARIWLNRPDARNAQNYGLLGELDEAFLRAEADEDVRVVILGGLGPAFSAGHDLGTPERLAENEAMARGHRPARYRGALAARVPALLREHAPLARPAQDHDRAGARLLHLRRADARLVL